MRIVRHTITTQPDRFKFGIGRIHSNNNPPSRDPRDRHMEGLILENKLLRQDSMAEGGYIRRLARNCFLGAVLGGMFFPVVLQINIPLNTIHRSKAWEAQTIPEKMISQGTSAGASAGLGAGVGAVFTRKRTRKDKREAAKLQA